MMPIADAQPQSAEEPQEAEEPEGHPEGEPKETPTLNPQLMELQDAGEVQPEGGLFGTNLIPINVGGPDPADLLSQLSSGAVNLPSNIFSSGSETQVQAEVHTTGEEDED